MGLWKWLNSPLVFGVQPSQEAEFDIEGLDVTGIERDGRKTIISYYEKVPRNYTVSPAGVHPACILTYVQVDETTWTCITTDDQHRNFVRRLAAKIMRAAQSTL